MRRGLFLVTAFVPFLLVACGEPAPSLAFEFESRSSAPTGGPITIDHAIRVGDGIRMTVRVKGDSVATGRSTTTIPLDMEMVTIWQCVDVTESGDRRIDVRLERLRAKALGGSDVRRERLAKFSGHVITSPSGRIKRVHQVGLDPLLAEQAGVIFSGAGFQLLVPLPGEGLRVGEALNLEEIMHPGAVENLLGEALANTALEPGVRGELVLMGTRSLDDDIAADFDVNLVLSLSGEDSSYGYAADLDYGFKITGRQSNSVKTGLPTGRSELTFVGRGRVESEGEKATIKVNMHMTIDCTEL